MGADTMHHKPSIFFVGTGNMGGPMAANLLRAGYPLSLFDKRPASLERLLANGGVEVESLQQGAASADVTIVSLPGPPEVREVLLGPSGLVASARPGATIIDTSTSSVELAQEIAIASAARGIRYLEAPITNAVDAAAAGKLTIFVGGERKDFDEAKPIFDVLGEKILYVGKHGNGAVTKLVTNQLWFVAAAAIGEGLMLAAKADIPLETISEAIRSSAGNSWVAEHDIPSIFAGHYDPSFTLALCCKDLGLIRQIASSHGLDLPMTEQAGRLFEEAKETYGPTAAELHVVRLLEDKSDFYLRPSTREDNKSS